MHIYKTTNLINGKIYIGQTSKSKQGYLGSGPIILKAVKKYGKENFSNEIIEECSSKEQLNEREIYWIKFYKATDRNTGYNISTGGNGGNLGEIVNKKISDITKSSGRMKGNTLRLGKIPYNKGIPMSEKQKEKMKKPKSEEHKNNLSKSKIGKHTKQILCITNGLTYNSIKEAGEKLNLTVPNIINVLKGRAKNTKGFSFQYRNHFFLGMLTHEFYKIFMRRKAVLEISH